MDILLGLYVLLFAVTALQGLREDLRFGAPLWKAGLSTVAKALGVAGMILVGFDRVDPALRLPWKAVFLVLVVEAAIQIRHLYRQRYQRVLPTGGPDDPQLRLVLLSSVILGLLASVPYFWLNAELAFGG